MKNQKVIVRTFSAGVFYGKLVSRKGQEATIKNARRLWYWKGAASLSQLAMEGVKCPSECKFPCPVASITIMQVIEVLSTTKVAQESIEGVPVWQM